MGLACKIHEDGARFLWLQHQARQGHERHSCQVVKRSLTPCSTGPAKAGGPSHAARGSSSASRRGAPAASGRLAQMTEVTKRIEKNSPFGSLGHHIAYLRPARRVARRALREPRAPCPIGVKESASHCIPPVFAVQVING